MISAVGAVEEIREFVESFAEGYGLDDFGAVGVREHPAEQEFVVNGLHRDEQYDPKNHVLNYCMSSNISGVIGSAVAAGVLISFLG